MTIDTAAQSSHAWLAYIGADSELVKSLQAAVDRVGATLVAPADLAAARSLDWPALGATAIVDARVIAASDNLMALIAALRARLGEAARIFYLIETGSIDQRLAALRAGADGVFLLSEDGREVLSARLADLVRDQASPPRVLIIDDEPVVALFAHRVLKGAGMEVSAVSDPRLALDALVTFRPDLVLMDLHMPGVSGIELTRLIRDDDQFHGLPIVFFSSEMDPDTRIETLRVGGDDFLAKPVTPERLLSVVRTRLRQARERPTKGPASPVHRLADRQALLRRLERRLSDPPDDRLGQGLLLIAPDPPPLLDEAADQNLRGAALDQLANGLAVCLAPREMLSLIPEVGFAVVAQRGDLRGLIALGKDLQAAGEALFSDFPSLGSALSLGVAPLDIPADDGLTLLSRAESALLEARRVGGQRIIVHTPAVSRQGADERDAQLRHLIEEALRYDRFRLFYQPIAALREGRGQPYDVRLRLCAADGEYIPTFDFIPAARRAGLMATIDRWVLERALTALQEGLVDHEGLCFLIQQDLETLDASDWIDFLRNLIASRGLIRQRPLLRFPCDQVVARLAMVQDRFVALRRLGIGICIDHFVDSPTIWPDIERLRPALVRLDFDRAAHQRPEALRALIARLHRNGARVIIANIEEPLAISQIWSSGADLIQGNFVQPPVPELSFDFSDTILE